MPYPALMFDEIPPHKRHRVYGLNCYLHAIGYETPMVISERIPEREDLNSAYYIKPQPGASFLKTKSPDHMTDEAFLNAIAEGCIEDGMLPIQKGDILSGEWYKVALYTTPESGKDFHFVRENEDGKWSDKIPFKQVQLYDTPPDIIQYYSLKKIFAAPRGIKPDVVKYISEDVALGGFGENKVHLMKSSSPAPLGPQMIIDTSKNVAFVVPDKQLVAMPKWPMRLSLGSPL